MLIRTFRSLQKLSSPYICLPCRLKQAQLSFLRQLRHESQQTAATEPTTSNKQDASTETSKDKSVKVDGRVKEKGKPQPQLSAKVKTLTKKRKVKHKGKSAVQRQVKASKDVDVAVKNTKAEDKGKSVVQLQTEASKDVEVAVKNTKVEDKAKSVVQLQTEASKNVVVAVKKKQVEDEGNNAVQNQREASKDVKVAAKKESSLTAPTGGRKRVSKTIMADSLLTSFHQQKSRKIPTARMRTEISAEAQLVRKLRSGKSDQDGSSKSLPNGSGKTLEAHGLSSDEQGNMSLKEALGTDREPKGLHMVTVRGDIKTITGSELEITPIELQIPSVPRLAHDLQRVLFNPGVYHLQDPRSRVYNFDPYLQKPMSVPEFDFSALNEYITSSKDQTLSEIARDLGKRYTGSTSSMTGSLAHFHYLLSGWRPINMSMISQGFPDKLRTFTQLQRSPAAIFLRWKDGTYAIDADKEFDSANILSMLGKSLEKLLTQPPEDFERYRRSNKDSVSKEMQSAPEAFHYSTQGDFLMRSQLDAHDERLPGTGMFDLKTRAVVSIRMDVRHYERGMGYELKTAQGEWESFEREYFDMIRSTMLKYSLQVRMGRMDGIFLVYHNIERIFGFQYVSLPEMDTALHGQYDTGLGDQEFKVSLELLNKILDRATAKFPQQSIRFHFETREAAVPFMYIFAEPVTEEQVQEIQTTNAEKVREFERSILGLDRSDGDEASIENEIEENSDGNWDTIRAQVEKEVENEGAFTGAEDGAEKNMTSIGDGPPGGPESKDEATSVGPSGKNNNESPGPATPSAPVTAVKDEEDDGDESEEEDDEKDGGEEDEKDEEDEEDDEDEDSEDDDQDEDEDEDGNETQQTTTEAADKTFKVEEGVGLGVNDISLEDFASHSTVTRPGAEENAKRGKLDLPNQTIESSEPDGALPASETACSQNTPEGIGEGKLTARSKLFAPNSSGTAFIGDFLREDQAGTAILDGEQRGNLVSVQSTEIRRTSETAPDPETLHAGEKPTARREDLGNLEGGESSVNPETSESPDAESLHTGEEPTAPGEDSATSADTTFLDALTPSTSASTDRPLLAMTLTIRSRVNDQYLLRPVNFKSTDKWTVEYTIEEITNPSRAWALYGACQTRRRARLGHVEEEGDDSALDYFRRKMSSMSQQGRAWRKKQDREDTETEREVVMWNGTGKERGLQGQERKIQGADDYMEWLYGLPSGDKQESKDGR